MTGADCSMRSIKALIFILSCLFTFSSFSSERDSRKRYREGNYAAVAKARTYLSGAVADLKRYLHPPKKLRNAGDRQQGEPLNERTLLEKIRAADAQILSEPDNGYNQRSKDVLSEAIEKFQQLTGWAFYPENVKGNIKEDAEILIRVCEGLCPRFHDYTSSIFKNLPTRRDIELGTIFYDWNAGDAQGIRFKVSRNEEGRIRHLAIYADGNDLLSGVIPEAIGGLHFLDTLILADGFLTGTLPSSMKNLTVLEYLDLSNNGLGYNQEERALEIDPEIFKAWTQVGYLNLSANRFACELPETIGCMEKLEVLDLSGFPETEDDENFVIIEESIQFKGLFPKGLASLSELRYLDVQLTGFEGTLPRGFENLSKLKGLTVSEEVNFARWQKETLLKNNPGLDLNYL